MANEQTPVACAVGPCPTPREDGSFFCAKHAGASYATKLPSARSAASPSPRRKAPNKAAMWVFAAVIVVIIVVVAAVNASSGNNGGTHDRNAGGTTGWASVLPSRAVAIANHGNPANIHIVRSTTKPFEGCARPNWYGWATSAGRQLAADELAWFIGHASAGSCPSYLYLFHDAAQTHRSGYNAGAVIYDGAMDVYVGTVIDGPMYEFRTS